MLRLKLVVFLLIGLWNGLGGGFHTIKDNITAVTLCSSFAISPEFEKRSRRAKSTQGRRTPDIYLGSLCLAQDIGIN